MAEDRLNGLTLLYIPFKPIAATYLTKLFNYIPTHNTPATTAREVFKPSTDSVRLLVSIEKNHFQFWVWGSLKGTSQVGVFLRFHVLLYPALDANRMGQHFGPSFCWKLGYPTSFRALDWLSSISGSKIMPQNPISSQNFYP